MKLKLMPTEAQSVALSVMAKEYIGLINDILDYAIAIDKLPKLTSATVNAPLPSTVRNECCRTAKSIYIKYKKGHVGCMPTLCKPVITWNNQNYHVFRDHLEFPMWDGQRSVRVSVAVAMTDEQYDKLKNAQHLGALRITQKNGLWIAQVVYQVEEPVTEDSGVMGIDLGIRCPAVAVCDNGKVRFFGNGRKNRVMRRRFSSKRKKLQKRGKKKAIEKLNNKENRCMLEIDHALSRQIVGFATKNHIGVIKLEKLTGIRKNIMSKYNKGDSTSARKSRKNNHEKSSWSFSRLAFFVEYKARLAGISVEYIDPAYTSQRCPHCGTLNHPNGRMYHCDCGYRCHRDLVGTRNILATQLEAMVTVA